METIGVKRLRDSLSRILRRVEDGEVIRVMRHGKEVVELRPVSTIPEQEVLYRLKDKGLVRGGAGKIGVVKSVKNTKPEMPISDLVAEDRR